jgi:hypothetical protein
MGTYRFCEGIFHRILMALAMGSGYRYQLSLEFVTLGVR